MRYDELEAILEDSLESEQLLGAVISKLRTKTKVPYQKVSIRPVELKGDLYYHITYHYPDKETHENLEAEETRDLILRLLSEIFRQGHFFAVDADWQALISKKGKLKLLKHPPSRKATIALNSTYCKKGSLFPF